MLTDWPGLTRGVSRGGADLMSTIDVRAVFKGVLREHYGIDDSVLDEFVFPGSLKIKRLTGLLRA